MEDSRDAVFRKLVAGASFQRSRFKGDIARFKPEPPSPSLAPAPGPAHASHLPPLDFFAEGRPRDNVSEPATDAGSETSASAHEGGPAPVRGQAGAKEESPAAPLSRRKAFTLRQEHHIKVSGTDVPPPFMDFTAAAKLYRVPEYLMRNMFGRGMRAPTPVQMQAIPVLMSGRDLLAVAPTGSGKTLAFVLPMLTKLRRPQRKGLRGVVLAHTKELAQQTERELRYLCKGRRWGIQTLQQTKASVNKQDIIVSTPARLLSLIEEQQADLSRVLFCVFDEADRLFDESHATFLQAVDGILRRCTHPDRRIAVFSATMPERAEDVIRSVLHEPCRVMIGTRTSACRDVEQSLVYCGKEQGKMEAVKGMIRRGIVPPVLVFVDKIDRAKDLYQELMVMGMSVAAIHSERSPAQREATVQEFRSGKLNILVCTELLSRGVDFKGVGTVINFDFPVSATSYVHRVGRTGRAGRKGRAITLWTDDDKEHLRPVASVIRGAGGEVPEWMLQLPKKRRRSDGRARDAPVRREAVSAVRRHKEATERNREYMRQKRDRERKPRKTKRSESAAAKPSASKASGSKTDRPKKRRRVSKGSG